MVVAYSVWRLVRRGGAVAVLCLSALALPAVAQDGPGNPALDWEQWFFGQRLYGLGYIPEDALARAVSQRDGSSAASRSAIQFSSALADAGADNAATESRWLSFGPAGINSSLGDLVSGRVNSLAIDPHNSSTLYLAAAGGGVWKSTTRGSRWDPLTDQLPSLASGAVAVDPFSGDVWYGTGELNFCRDCYYGAGVYRSSDGGATWTRVNPDGFLSSPTSLIAFDPRHQGTIFIGRSTALWKSSDGGQSWRAVLQGAAVTGFLLNPADSSIAYAALGNFSGAPANGIYRSADGGETWTRVSAGLPQQQTMGRVALGISPTAPSILYALIARSDDFNLNGLFRSADGGGNWSLLNTLPSDFFTEDGAGQGAFNMVVKVDPRDAAVLYVGGSSFWKSTDFGASWQDLGAAANLHEDPHDVIFDPADPQTFYLIGDSGVWRSADGGKTFADLNQTLAIAQFQTVGLHPTNPLLAVGGTQDNGTVLYQGASLWEQGRPGDSGAAFYDLFNPQIVYTVSRRFSLRRSDDGGKNFHEIASGLDPSDRVLFYPPFLNDPNQEGVLYFASQRVWRSRDRGDHWDLISGDLTGGQSAAISALAVSRATSQVLYAGTSDGRVQVSADGAASWAPTASLPNRFVTSITVDPEVPQRAVVGLSGFGTGHVFRTDNLGGAWEDISRNLPDVPVNAVLLDAIRPETVYVGTDIGVFVLGADGTWAPLQDGLPNVIVLGLSQNARTGLMAAATHGRGVFAIATGGPAAIAPHMAYLGNAGGFEPGPLAPGMLAALFGTNLAASSATATNPPPLPTALAGTRLLVNGTAAPLFYASPSQLNFQVPFELTGPMAELRLQTAAGEAVLHIARADARPGIFANGLDGSILHTDGGRVSNEAPAHAGELLVLFGTGLGAVDSGVASGAAAPLSPPAKTVSSPLVRVGGVLSEVRFSGLTPGAVGLNQINFVVPPGVSGSVSVSVEMNGATSNSVLIRVLP